MTQTKTRALHDKTYPNESPAYREARNALLEAEINIHYVYSFIKRPEGKAALLFNIEDADIAVQSLTKRGLKVLSQRDISR